MWAHEDRCEAAPLPNVVTMMIDPPLTESSFPLEKIRCWRSTR